MVRGVVLGGMVLIALYVLGQSGTSSKVSGATTLISGGLHRFMSPEVAGVPQRKAATGSGSTSTPTTPPASGAWQPGQMV